MTKRKYKIGIQKSILKFIKQSKELNLEYVTVGQIIDEVQRKYKSKKNIEQRVYQSLYHLQKETKYNKPRIKRFIDDSGKKLGYTLTD